MREFKHHYRKILIFISIAISVLLPLLSIASSLQYIYDPLGRLQATVSENGEATVYTYDSVGNLLYVTKETLSPIAPALQGINPDVLFIGSTTSAAIEGQNLLTVKKIETGNPFVSVEITGITDTRIMTEITVSPEALPGPVTLTVTTQYGSANIQTNLVTAHLSLGPALLSLAPGTGTDITATIYPSLGRAVTVQIANSGPYQVGAPQSVTIPATGTVSFGINALREGVAYIYSGWSVATVYVTASAFTPVQGEQLTPAAGPVSVYIDSPGSSPTTSSAPVSAYIDSPPGSSVAQSIPFSIYIDSPAGGSTTAGALPVSTYIDSPPADTTLQSGPVSTKISP